MVLIGIITIVISTSTKLKNNRQNSEDNGSRIVHETFTIENRDANNIEKYGLINWSDQYALVYDLNMDSALFLDSFELPATKITITGKLKIQSSTKKLETSVVLTFIDPTFIIEQLSKEDPEKKDIVEAKIIESQLQQSFVLISDNSGHIKNLKIPTESSIQVQSTIKNIASMLQFVKNSDSNDDDWETTEFDTTGLLNASYKKIDKNHFVKQKLEYSKIKNNNGRTIENSLTAQIIENKSQLFLNNERIIQSLSVVDDVQISGSQMFSKTEAVTHLKIKLSDKSLIDGKTSSIDPAISYTSVTIDGPATKKAIRNQIDLAKIAGIDIHTALDILDENSGDSKQERQKRDRTFIAMEALLRQKPATIKDALNAILDKNKHSAMLISALGYAGTREAQSALEDLFNRSKQLGIDSLAVLQALSLTETPANSDIEFLHSLMDIPEYANQARYGIGSLIHNAILSGNTEAASNGLSILTDDLHSCQNSPSCITTLLALGNAGHPASIAVVTPFLSNPDPQLRIAAVQALRRINGIEPESLIISTAINDLDENVRLTSLSVLGSRDPHTKNGLTAVIDRATKDSSAKIRYSAVSTLTHFSKIDPESVKNTLKWIGDNDPETKIREAALKML